MTAPTAVVQSLAWHPSPCASESQPATEQPKSGLSAYSDKDSAELRALHSDHVKDMAHNYATDFSDLSLVQNKAVHTHRLLPLEERESARLHHEDEAPGPRNRGFPKTSPYFTLKYIRAHHPLELSQSSSSLLQLNNERSILSVGQAS